MKRVLYFAFAMALAVVTTAPAMAAVFSWDVAPAAGDQLSIKLQNWEPSFSQVASEGFLYGVLRVTSIENLTSGALAWQATPGVDEITGVFNNYKFDAVNSTATTFLFTGGNIDLWFDDSPETTSVLGNKMKGTNAAPDADGGIWTDGQKLMSLSGNPGVISGAGGPYTIKTDVTGPASGTGRGFLDVILGSGLLASDFNNNAFPTDSGLTFADFNFHTTLQPTNAAAGKYLIFSNDPIDTKFVPEPMSAVIWCGILGVAAAGGVLHTRKSKRLAS